jgi:hypothetical protein
MKVLIGILAEPSLLTGAIRLTAEFRGEGRSRNVEVYELLSPAEAEQLVIDILEDERMRAKHAGD